MTIPHLLRDPVILLLLAASLVSWTIIIGRVMALWGARRADARHLRGQAAPDAPLARLTALLGEATGQRGERVLVLLDTAIARERARLEGLLPLLGVIGTTAPYVGLLGTVIGIIQAFAAIQTQNNMSPSVVAGGLSAALIATAAGLAVAIPAVAAHHLLMSAIRRRVAAWEAELARALPEEAGAEVDDESFTLA